VTRWVGQFAGAVSATRPSNQEMVVGAATVTGSRGAADRGYSRRHGPGQTQRPQPSERFSPATQNPPASAAAGWVRPRARRTDWASRGNRASFDTPLPSVLLSASRTRRPINVASGGGPGRPRLACRSARVKVDPRSPSGATAVATSSATDRSPVLRGTATSLPLCESPAIDTKPIGDLDYHRRFR